MFIGRSVCLSILHLREGAKVGFGRGQFAGSTSQYTYHKNVSSFLLVAVSWYLFEHNSTTFHLIQTNTTPTHISKKRVICNLLRSHIVFRTQCFNTYQCINVKSSIRVFGVAAFACSHDGAMDHLLICFWQSRWYLPAVCNMVLECSGACPSSNGWGICSGRHHLFTGTIKVLVEAFQAVWNWHQ